MGFIVVQLFYFECIRNKFSQKMAQKYLENWNSDVKIKSRISYDVPIWTNMFPAAFRGFPFSVFQPEYKDSKFLIQKRGSGNKIFGLETLLRGADGVVWKSFTFFWKSFSPSRGGERNLTYYNLDSTFIKIFILMFWNCLALLN